MAAAAAQATGFAGQLQRGPAIMEDWSAIFDHHHLMSSAKARRELGWVPKQAGILAQMDRCYHAWQAGQPAASPRQIANNTWM